MILAHLLLPDQRKSLSYVRPISSFPWTRLNVRIDFRKPPHNGLSFGFKYLATYTASGRVRMPEEERFPGDHSGELSGIIAREVELSPGSMSTSIRCIAFIAPD